MKTQIIVDRSKKTFFASQIDVHSFKIQVYFGVNKLVFIVSLQPTGDPDVLPTYQLFPKSQNISSGLIRIMPDLSEWLKSTESKNNYQ